MSTIGNNVVGSYQSMVADRLQLIVGSSYIITAVAGEQVDSFSIMNHYLNLGKSVEIGIYDITSDIGDGIFDSSTLVGATSTIAGTNDLSTVLTTGALATPIALTEGQVYAIGARPDAEFYTQTVPYIQDVAEYQDSLLFPSTFVSDGTDNYTKHFFATTSVTSTGSVTIDCTAAFNQGNVDYTIDPVIVSSVLGFNVGMSVILDMGLAGEVIASPVTAIDKLPTATPKIQATFSEPIGVKTVHVVYDAAVGDIQSVTGEKPLDSITFELTAPMIC